MAKEVIEEGIYFDLPEAVYHNAEGLSCSGMKQLAISPLNYWHKNYNHTKEQEEESYPMRFGKAVHCRLLEPERFAREYTTELCKEDYVEVLDTMDDMKGFLTLHGLPTTAKKKQELIDRILESGHSAVIWGQEKARFESENEGKIILSKQEMARIEALAATALNDPFVASVVIGGMPEVSFFVRDPETGVMLKARMDYVRVAATIDVKTFSNSRGKPIDRAVFDAINYESYHLQCVSYHRVRELARQRLASGDIQTFGNVSEAWLKGFIENDKHGFGFLFIESDAPFEMRLVYLKPTESAGGQPNIYWLNAENRMQELTLKYANCLARYGTDQQWREQCKPYVLLDADLPQMMFS